MDNKILRNVLSREEMRGVIGGKLPNFENNCHSDCSPDGANTCASADCPNSYCATYHCGPSNTRIHSCQYQ
ncbi:MULTISPECIES: hypothetical protein [Flavobacterium]|uniref:Bacteriocin n=1 Tax=Flavobacterium hankyongi TaxID=1176532 RepID=A0ABP9A4X4_9FLAO|nr:hypothetical protein [Flavobacterium sp. N1846]